MPQLTSPNLVTETPAADPAVALAHFKEHLAFETDTWDVHESMKRGADGFIVIDVRSLEDYQEGHVPGAIHLPGGKITEKSLAQFPEDALLVVYCSGPHCNGADKAAVKISALGRKVKKMIGGSIGWEWEGFEFEKG